MQNALPCCLSDPLAKQCHRSFAVSSPLSLQCFCSRHGDNPTESRPAECDMKCLGDIKQTCGGRNAISIYKYSLNIPKPTATKAHAYQALGCFADEKYDRVFDVSLKKDGGMTAEVRILRLEVPCTSLLQCTTERPQSG